MSQIPPSSCLGCSTDLWFDYRRNCFFFLSWHTSRTALLNVPGTWCQQVQTCLCYQIGATYRSLPYCLLHWQYVRVASFRLPTLYKELFMSKSIGIHPCLLSLRPFMHYIACLWTDSRAIWLVLLTGKTV